MPLSGSARAMKCKLKKDGKTESQAMTYLIEHGYITPIIKSNADLGSRHNIPPGNDETPVSEPHEITESYAEQFLIRCAMQNPGDPKVADLLIKWLDKKKALEPKINLDEQSNTITEYKNIREQFYGRNTACSDAPID